MCNPMLAFAGVQAAGSLMQGYSARSAGRAQQTVLDAQAVAEMDAAQAEADKIGRRTRSARGAARTALAGAGVQVDSATAMDIDEDITQRGSEDARMALLTGQRRASELRFQGRMARIQGNAGFAQSFLQAGSQIGQGWAMSRSGGGGSYGGWRGNNSRSPVGPE